MDILIGLLFAFVVLGVIDYTGTAAQHVFI